MAQPVRKKTASARDVRRSAAQNEEGTRSPRVAPRKGAGRTQSEHIATEGTSRVADTTRDDVHPFLRFQELMKQLENGIANNFLTAVRHALTSSKEIAATAFAAYYTSQLPECQEPVRDLMAEMRRGWNPGDGVNRFIYLVFWRVQSVEKRASQHLRRQITAVVQVLNVLVRQKKWPISKNVSVSEIIAKIDSLGGITAMYDKWTEEQKAQNDTSLYQRHKATAERLGMTIEDVVRKEKEQQDQHQQQRQNQNENRLISMLTTISEEVSWERTDRLMLIAAVRDQDGKLTLRRFRLPYQQRMIHSVVNPVNPIT